MYTHTHTHTHTCTYTCINSLCNLGRTSPTERHPRVTQPRYLRPDLVIGVRVRGCVETRHAHAALLPQTSQSC